MSSPPSLVSPPSADREIQEGQRFEFGKNWAQFLLTLDNQRIREAELSLKEMLGCENLNGLRFLDMGCGSGLFSLAAHRLGATVVSIDYDPASVACARSLKERFAPADSTWIIQQGSVLDKTFVESLGLFNVVYSWGVLHHTGQMWQALDNIRLPVAADGKLFIAIYNDQGRQSKLWWWVKRLYCSGTVGKYFILLSFIPYFFSKAILKSILTRSNVFSTYKSQRGMSLFYDWYDWLGGFPFEVASTDAIFNFYKKFGFTLLNLKSTSSSGNNQFVFQKI